MDDSNPSKTEDPQQGTSGTFRAFSRLFTPGFGSSFLSSTTTNRTNSAEPPASTSRSSPYSPFAFGSPLTFSRRSVLNPVNPSNNRSELNESAPAAPENSTLISKCRARGREMYGGRVMFGGTNNSGVSGMNIRRHNRLLAATPYQTSMSNRSKRQATAAAAQVNASTAIPSQAQSETRPMDQGSTLSSTAKVIWRTLERMSTPVQDALKIPVPRAEKRRELAEQLLDRAFGVRRRPTLTPSSSPAKGSGLLNGPPLRTKMFSPVNAKKVTSPMKSSVYASKLREEAVKPVPILNNSAVIPALLGGGQAPSSSPSTAVSETPKFSVGTFESPATASSGKIRAKVGEKSKLRAEKEIDEPAPEIPSYLNKNTWNPFSAMNSAPHLKIDQAKKPNDEQPTSSPSEKKPSVSTETKEVKAHFDMNPPKNDPKKVLERVFEVSSPEKPKEESAQFSFSEPKTLLNSPGSASQTLFKFSPPIVMSSQNGKTDLSTFKSASESTSFEVGSSRAMTNRLPDLTANAPNSIKATFAFSPKPSSQLKSGSVLDVLGGNNKLPDVTASAGIQPAKSLERGSVMDILGKKTDSDGWTPSKSNKSPWQL